MTSEALNPSWQYGDVDVQIGNASLQLGYKDHSPTSRSRRLTVVKTGNARRPPNMMLGTRRRRNLWPQ